MTQEDFDALMNNLQGTVDVAKAQLDEAIAAVRTALEPTIEQPQQQ
jgi:hypothetical protein